MKVRSRIENFRRWYELLVWMLGDWLHGRDMWYFPGLERVLLWSHLSSASESRHTIHSESGVL